MDLQINGLEKSPSRLSKCYVSFISPGRENRSLFLFKIILCGFGSLSIANELPSITSMEITSQIPLDSYSKHPNLKMHMQKNGVCCKHLGVFFANCTFSSLVLVMLGLKISNIIESIWVQRKVQHANCTDQPFIHNPPGRSMCCDRTAVLNVFGSSGTFFYLFSFICIHI